MKKISSILKKIGKGFVCCGLSFQFVVGIVYIISNFGRIPNYQDTQIYMRMSEHLVLDDYAGVLYPLLLRVCQAIKIVPVQMVLYTIQLLVGLLAGYRVAQIFRAKTRNAILFSVWMNTIPFVVQGHVTVLPNSLCTSLSLMILGDFICATKEQKALRKKVCVTDILLSVVILLLSREYQMVVILLFGWMICIQLYHNKRKKLYTLLTAVCCTVVLVANYAFYHALEQPGYYGKIQNTMEANLFQRFGICVLQEKYAIYLPTELQEQFQGLELDDFGKFLYKCQTEFAPRIEDTYGRERADEIYWEIAKFGLQNSAKDNIRAWVTDLSAYLVPMAGYAACEDGQEYGSTSWNYQQFLYQSPRLSACYINGFYQLWFVCAVGGLFVFILNIRGRKEQRNIDWIAILLFLGLYALAYSYGPYDYKLATIPLVIESLPMWYLVQKLIFTGGKEY